jgi:F0F1-type ATP synthase assembly protein I
MEEATPPPEPSSEPATQQPSVARGAVEFMTLGLSAAMALVVGGGLGYLLDRWIGTTPLFTLIGVALGLVTAIMMVRVRVRKYLP